VASADAGCLEAWQEAIALIEEDGGLLAAFDIATRKRQADLAEIAGDTRLCPLRIFPEGGIYASCPSATDSVDGDA
jgi:hypothetical protein